MDHTYQQQSCNSCQPQQSQDLYSCNAYNNDKHHPHTGHKDGRFPPGDGNKQWDHHNNNDSDPQHANFKHDGNKQWGYRNNNDGNKRYKNRNNDNQCYNDGNKHYNNHKNDNQPCNNCDNGNDNNGAKSSGNQHGTCGSSDRSQPPMNPSKTQTRKPNHPFLKNLKREQQVTTQLKLIKLSNG